MRARIFSAVLTLLTLTSAGAAAQGLDQMDAGLKTGAPVADFIVAADQSGVKKNSDPWRGNAG